MSCFTTNIDVLIEDIIAREILDSRGNPTIEVDIYTSDGCIEEELLFHQELQPVSMKRLSLEIKMNLDS